MLRRENEQLFCKLARTQTELRTKKAYLTRLEYLLHQRSTTIDEPRGKLEQSREQIRRLDQECEHWARLVAEAGSSERGAVVVG